jgi:hypothetical protein
MRQETTDDAATNRRTLGSAGDDLDQCGDDRHPQKREREAADGFYRLHDMPRNLIELT